MMRNFIIVAVGVLTVLFIAIAAGNQQKVKQTKCVWVPPEQVHSNIIESAKLGFKLVNHIEIHGCNSYCAPTTSIVLIYEK